MDIEGIAEVNGQSHFWLNKHDSTSLDSPEGRINEFELFVWSSGIPMCMSLGYNNLFYIVLCTQQVGII